MSTKVKARRFYGLLGFAGFLLCAWFAYQCGIGARDSASRAYTAWLSGSDQSQAAARQNALWVVAMGASLLFGLVFLSTCFFNKRTAVLRVGLGLMLLVGSCLPLSFAVTISSPLLKNLGAAVSGPRVTSWSAGAITLQGWQLYAGALLSMLATLSLLAGGAYLLFSRPPDGNE